MRTLAIIPARGGSKRISRKNIKLFSGVPVIAFSIRAALASGCFEEVMVSTDDEEIAEVARQYGAQVPFMRSAKTSDDYATTADVIREVLEEYKKRGKEFDALACIYATAPYITAQRLENACRMLESGETKAAFTCVEYSYPIQRCLVIDDNGRIGMKFPQYANSRTQDLQKTYHDAGQFYFTTVEAFEQCGSLWGPDTKPIILPETEVQDLDTPTDWKLAEMKYELLTLPKRFDAGDYEFVAYTELDERTSEIMRQGRNAPDVRVQMINTEEISPKTHKEFIENLRTRHDKQYYAIYEKGTDRILGSITLDRIDDAAIERGIWLFSDARGKGHATRLLNSLYDYLAKERGIKTIETKVKKDNDASLALEERLESERNDETDNLINFTNNIY